MAGATGLGVMHVDDQQRVVAFVEKPKDPPSIPGRPDRALASMGVYVFNADFLYEQLIRDHDDPHSSHDFGKDLLPWLVGRGEPVYAHPVRRIGDLGNVDDFIETMVDALEGRADTDGAPAAASSVGSMSSWEKRSLFTVPGLMTPGQRMAQGTR